MLNDLGHMSKFITIQHVKLFLLLFDTSLHMVQLDPGTIWFWGKDQNAHRLAATTVICAKFRLYCQLETAISEYALEPFNT